MDIGALIDYCVTWNELHGLNKSEDETDENGKPKAKVRNATQADIDAFLGH